MGGTKVLSKQLVEDFEEAYKLLADKSWGDDRTFGALILLGLDRFFYEIDEPAHNKASPLLEKELRGKQANDIIHDQSPTWIHQIDWIEEKERLEKENKALEELKKEHKEGNYGV